VLGHTKYVNWNQYLSEENLLLARDAQLYAIISSCYRLAREYYPDDYRRALEDILARNGEESNILHPYSRVDRRRAEHMADHLRGADLTKHESKAKLVVYSGSPYSGKATIYSAFIQKYGDLVKRIVLFTSRRMRRDETRDRDYYFRSINHIKALEQKGKVITCQVDGMVQAIALEDFEDRYVDPITGEESTVFIEGLSSIFRGGNIVLFECNYKWLNKLKGHLGEELNSILILPYPEEETPDNEVFTRVMSETAFRLHQQEMNIAGGVFEERLKDVPDGTSTPVHMHVPMSSNIFNRKMKEAQEYLNHRLDYAAVIPNHRRMDQQSLKEHIDWVVDIFAMTIFGNVIKDIKGPLAKRDITETEEFKEVGKHCQVEGVDSKEWLLEKLEVW
jgi:hypothetical protein